MLSPVALAEALRSAPKGFERPGSKGRCTALRGTSQLDSLAPVPVLLLLAETAPVALSTNPNEAFCGVETLGGAPLSVVRAGSSA
jgi:hypothetical protein